MAVQPPVPALYKNIIISGGARGIGRALTRMMLEAGHHAYIMDIDEEELEHTTKTHLKQYYEDGRLGSSICDLRNVEDIRAKVKEAAKFFNDRIDVLINNGGIASPQWKDGKTMEDLSTIDEWQAYMDTNLTAPFAMSQACIPYMKARASDFEHGAHIQNANNSSPAGPCIIHIGSFRAHQSDPNQEGYASSKSGQIGLMHSMAISLGRLGIRVNLIAPGRIKVAHESKEGDEKGADWASQISEKDVSDHPTNRAGRPKDIADAALYLIEAGFVTGQDITSRLAVFSLEARNARILSPGCYLHQTSVPHNSVLDALKNLAAGRTKSDDFSQSRPVLEPAPFKILREEDLRFHPTAIVCDPVPVVPLHGPGLDEKRKQSSKRHDMSHGVEIITTPTGDTAGTTLIFRTSSKHYVFGSMAEGTQRATVEQGVRLLKAQDFFLTGKADWKNMGGIMGMMLTLADSSTSSYTTAMEIFREAQKRGKKGGGPQKPHFDIYGPPNLKHMLGTCRRFIFRKGLPINTTEYGNHVHEKDENGAILPTWQDSMIKVWALSVSPTVSEHNAQAEAELESRRRHFDTKLNTFAGFQAPENESPEAREKRYDQIRTATIKFMFDSNWSFDTLVERHISEVDMPAAMFIRDPATKGFQPYHGPKPGGSDPLPDITVWTRTPWPGAGILALPPTKPAPEAISYIVKSHPVRGQFDVASAKALGVTPGPDYGKLTNGIPVKNAKGELIHPNQVMGPDRPGQGIAILDVPSVAYVESIVRKEELSSPDVMTGIRAIVWMLGPGVAGHPVLTEFMEKLSDVQHFVSSVDTAPNRVSFNSVAGQATRLNLIDPKRYSTLVFDSTEVPQKTVHRTTPARTSSLPPNIFAADRGMTFTLMPKFEAHKETATPLFDLETARKEASPEVLELAQKAQESLRQHRGDMLKWRQLLARPDTEITTLGTGSALPSKYRNVSATLVRVPGVGNYLLDCGENTLGQLSRVFSHEEFVDVLKNLRMIWISHLHADHHLGTAAVIKAWYQLVHNSVPNPHTLGNSTDGIDVKSYGLSVISHRGMLQWLNEYSSVEDFGYSRILPLQLTPNEKGKSSTLSVLNSFEKLESENPSIHRREFEQLLGFEDIQSAHVAHCHGSMAVTFTFPRSPSDPEDVKPLKVSYSGDCRPSYHFGRVGADTTVLIHEATFDDELIGDAKAKKHSTTSEALGVGEKMNAKAVVLTHFSQRYQNIPVLQPVEDEQADNLLPEDATEDVVDDEADADPTTENADNMDIHPAKPSLQHQPTTGERVIKIRNKDMKVAIAFDYMRVKIGDICEMEKFNDALNALLVTEDEEVNAEGEADGAGANANGKRC
ncbi:ElaC Metal-dependent hydrolase of the beta-lactamase superfamily III [Pyrenophora tritici-repentis]|nr:ElaC Metal-dependent hydrolase of the beta-lactamase superfamily III [Pyrenophora tritici-repentis]KAI1528562.1 ElaC Metal-dependent hydrolase of the beta-lactamase superfamily III [Pyrenophora tritici-repentis]KAI1555305.1 ElaC Metal-dependent hydrolase of the beta-lactamase superfamily III [Pyrenophora tritici-repentis]KAI1562956.1 ElaC Metal-dependent hydrolase of the beta-lactamase superfamily III [Pyrenophora tritici-repentis]KAI1596417.1 ElaC Metal-dependent hydrolase of the beta-lacta